MLVELSSCDYADNGSWPEYGESSSAVLFSLSGWRIERDRELYLMDRNQAYLSTLRQEPEFADRSAGDIVSRLSVDTSILGDSVTNNLSDGMR